MNKILVLFFACFLIKISAAQDVNTLFKEANNLELKFKDDDALLKYKQIIAIDENNVKALIKAAELSCATGARNKDANAKKALYLDGLSFAKKAVALAPNNADAYVVLATANGKMTEVETDKKQIVAYVRETKINADNALSINANHALANFIEGKWHYEMINLNWAKRLAVKALYGGLPTASIEQAAFYLEKSRKADPYNALTFLTLAKVYKEKTSPTEMIEVLEKLIKLPRRTIDDAAYIEEGKKMLEENR
ncbi:MAG: hypothetical protein ACOVMM_00280 [Chitinophagaceae bacterium]